MLLPPLPDRDRAALGAELPSSVGVERLEPVRPSLAFTYLKALKQIHYSRRTALDTFQIKYQRRRQQAPAFHYAMSAAEGAGRVLMPEPVVDALLGSWSQPFESHYRRLLSRVKAHGGCRDETRLPPRGTAAHESRQGAGHSHDCDRHDLGQHGLEAPAGT